MTLSGPFSLFDRVARHGAILCGHGISVEPNGSSLHVTPDELYAALSIARRLGDVVRLTDILDQLEAGRSTAGMFALTFDDAYESLSEVIPTLLETRTPATVFVVSSAAETGDRFWWDRLEATGRNASPSFLEKFRNRMAVGSVNPSEMRDELLVRYRGRTSPQLNEALCELEDLTGVRASQRSMTFAELMTIPPSSKVEFGVHTVSHALLPLLSHSEAVQEIQTAYQQLKHRLGDAVSPVLAIPFGLYDRSTAAIAHEAGMRASLSLNQVSLKSRIEAGPIPRISLSRGQKGWKLLLKLAGLADRRQIRRGALLEPTIPGSTRALRSGAVASTGRLFE